MIETILKSRKFRFIIKVIIPRPLIFKIWGSLAKIRARKARAAFEESPQSPPWLQPYMLGKLQQNHQVATPWTDTPDILKKRGTEHAKYLLKLMHNEPNSFLDLGCGRWARACWALRKLGKSAVGIDIAEVFDEESKSEGVQFLQADAECLGFKDETFDCVFSYASFEHFANPESVLQEAIRVVKTAGYIYLNFGPLYMSPMGLHAHYIISVPYCQFLFQPEVLQQFANERPLETIDFHNKRHVETIAFDTLNRWSLEEFRSLWDHYRDRLQIIKYYEHPIISDLDLIAKYPSCFKSKTDNFDNLIIDSIEVLFKKIR